MSYERITKRVYRCKCDVCGHPWDAETLPERCQARDCRVATWNGIDKRKGSFRRVRKGSTK